MKKNKWTLFTLFMMILIFWFSSQNASSSNAQSHFFSQYLSFIPVFYIRKAAHMTLYALLSICIIQSLKKDKIVYCLSLCFFYACSDEFHQLFVLGRSGESRDVCIDLFGSCIGLFLFFLLKKVVHRRLSNSTYFQ